MMRNLSAACTHCTRKLKSSEGQVVHESVSYLPLQHYGFVVSRASEDLVIFSIIPLGNAYFLPTPSLGTMLMEIGLTARYKEEDSVFGKPPDTADFALNVRYRGMRALNQSKKNHGPEFIKSTKSMAL
jgi:hypothetical protein